jgi:hypothetical protein
MNFLPVVLQHTDGEWAMTHLEGCHHPPLAGTYAIPASVFFIVSRTASLRFVPSFAFVLRSSAHALLSLLRTVGKQAKRRVSNRPTARESRQCHVLALRRWFSIADPPRRFFKNRDRRERTSSSRVLVWHAASF